jgi:hypothetical protein
MINIEAQQGNSGISSGSIKVTWVKDEKNCYGADRMNGKVKFQLSNLNC